MMSVDTQKNWIELLLIALAAYRVTRAVTVEDGPFGVFAVIRDWVLRRRSDDHWLNRGFSCPYCVSFWVVPVMYFMPDLVILWLGLAGLTSLIFSWEFR